MPSALNSVQSTVTVVTHRNKEKDGAAFWTIVVRTILWDTGDLSSRLSSARGDSNSYLPLPRTLPYTTLPEYSTFQVVAPSTPVEARPLDSEEEEFWGEKESKQGELWFLYNEEGTSMGEGKPEFQFLLLRTSLCILNLDCLNVKKPRDTIFN